VYIFFFFSFFLTGAGWSVRVLPAGLHETWVVCVIFGRLCLKAPPQDVQLSVVHEGRA